MKKPRQQPQERIEELKEEPYKYFEGVDYKRIMALNIESIKIDSKNEQKSVQEVQLKQAKHKSKCATKQGSKALGSVWDGAALEGNESSGNIPSQIQSNSCSNR